MTELFLNIFNISVTATWIALAVILLRFIFKKIPKYLRCIMWGIVALRLVFPISIESVFSLIPSAETLPPDMLYSQTPIIESGIEFINSTVNPIMSVTLSPTVGYQFTLIEIVISILSVIWVMGIIAMLVYAIISYIKIKVKVNEAVLLDEGMLLCDRISTPFILGIFKPKIYLPSNINLNDMQYVVLHEKAHLKRRDHLIKPFGFLLLTFYWFNPILWISYILFCKDIELACDEKVITTVNSDIKVAYSNALVNCSSRERIVSACPLAFSETGVKDRIKSVLSYKKPTVWIIIMSVVLCVVLSLCFLTNPLKTVNEELAVFIDCEIASHHQSDKSVDNFCCLDWEVLGIESIGTKTSVYMWVLYQEYNLQNGEITVVSGAYIPTKITVQKENGSYKLIEYFEPDDGTKYVEDIRTHFPLRLQDDALNSKKYIDRQQNKCDKMAQEYFEENVQYVGKTYTYDDSPEIMPPSIFLADKDNYFSFSFSLFSSYLAHGEYELTDETLTLKTYDGKNVYVFDVLENGFSFNASKSSEIPKYRYSSDSYEAVSPVPDGAIFE